MKSEEWRVWHMECAAVCKFCSPILLSPRSAVVGNRKQQLSNHTKFKFCYSKFKIQALHSAQTHLSSEVSLCLTHFLYVNYAKTSLVSFFMEGKNILFIYMLTSVGLVGSEWFGCTFTMQYFEVQIWVGW